MLALAEPPPVFVPSSVESGGSVALLLRINDHEFFEAAFAASALDAATR